MSPERFRNFKIGKKITLLIKVFKKSKIHFKFEVRAPVEGIFHNNLFMPLQYQVDQSKRRIIHLIIFRKF